MISWRGRDERRWMARPPTDRAAQAERVLKAILIVVLIVVIAWAWFQVDNAQLRAWAIEGPR